MPGNPLSDPNWAADVTNQITTFVGNVRDKTTGNVVKAVRGLVFGLLATFLGLFAVVVLLVMLARALQSLLDIWVDWATAVWISYLFLGGLFVLAGLILMSKRHSA
jgi:uncharacterized membrane protein YedE/YeeE